MLGGIAETGQEIGGAPGLLVFFRSVHEDGIGFLRFTFFVFSPGPIFGEGWFLREIHRRSGTEHAQFAPIAGRGEDVALQLEDFAGGVEGVREAFQFVVSLGRTAEFKPAVTSPKDPGDRTVNGWSIPHKPRLA